MDQTEEQKWLHETRQEIDVIIQKIKAVKIVHPRESKFAPAMREVKLSYTALQESKMWLGQALGEMGSVLPQQFADKAPTTVAQEPTE